MDVDVTIIHDTLIMVNMIAEKSGVEKDYLQSVKALGEITGKA